MDFFLTSCRNTRKEIGDFLCPIFAYLTYEKYYHMKNINNKSRESAHVGLGHHNISQSLPATTNKTRRKFHQQ